MIDKNDIYRTAQILIKGHGNGAINYVDEMFQQFLIADDIKAAGVWLQIGAAVEDLLNRKKQGKLH